MTCEQVRRDSLAEQYLCGELEETAADEFEAHFFGCRSCFEDVKTLTALQQELRETPVTRPVRTWRWAWALMPLAAAVAFLWMISARGEPRPAAHVEAPRAAPLAGTLLELARIQPPSYEESRLRGAVPEAGRLFRQAMSHYTRGEYEQAIAGLRSAVRADAVDPGSRFFLGICLLLTGRSEEGIEALRGSIALGDSGYLEEARFYLAKALLGQGKIGPARQELEVVIALRGDLEPEARKLIARLQSLP